MPDDKPHFDDAGRLIAPKYGDVYFSAEDGLAETAFVFLEGNQLAERFAAMQAGETFTIGETGFGTGLNFLAAWQLFDQHAPQDALLQFISVEGFPLDRDSVRQALAPWPSLKASSEAMLDQWGNFWPGVHPLQFDMGRVRLTLLVGEADEVLATLNTPIDAWFLDGFAPSRNPAMWSKEVFAHVARNSQPGTTLATYTAAGFVRRGLGAVGFEIEKRPGFGTKRDMTAGVFTAGQSADAMPTTAVQKPSPSSQQHSAIVIGGALAGAFAANALAQRGISVTVIERQRLVDGQWPSMTRRIAVLQPKINNQSDGPGGVLRDGFALVERRLRTDWQGDARIAWSPCGTFNAAVDDRSTRRLKRFVEQFEPTGLCRWIDAEQTQAEVGVALPVGGVVVESAGVLRPAGLCAALLDHPLITVHDGAGASSLEREGDQWRAVCDDGAEFTASSVVLANALDAQRFDKTQQLDLRPVRGQATLLRSAEQGGGLASLRRAIFYGGYVTPAVDGVQMLGASFIPGDTDLHWRDSEHGVVCDQLARVLPDEAERLRASPSADGWVGLRITTPTQYAYAQAIDDDLYVSLGHGSYGIASAAAVGERLASLVGGVIITTR